MIFRYNGPWEPSEPGAWSLALTVARRLERRGGVEPRRAKNTKRKARRAPRDRARSGVAGLTGPKVPPEVLFFLNQHIY